MHIQRAHIISPCEKHATARMIHAMQVRTYRSENTGYQNLTSSLQIQTRSTAYTYMWGEELDL